MSSMCSFPSRSLIRLLIIATISSTVRRRSVLGISRLSLLFILYLPTLPRLYLRGSKKMLLIYSLAFSIRAGSLGLSLRKSSSIAASGVLVLSLSMVADMAGSTSQTQILVLPLSQRASRSSFVSLLFFWMATDPSPSPEMMASARSMPLTSSSTRSLSTSFAPKRERSSSVLWMPKALSIMVTGIFFLLSILTDRTSPGARSNSIHAPRSGISLAINDSWPGMPSSALR